MVEGQRADFEGVGLDCPDGPTDRRRPLTAEPPLQTIRSMAERLAYTHPQQPELVDEPLMVTGLIRSTQGHEILETEEHPHRRREIGALGWPQDLESTKGRVDGRRVPAAAVLREVHDDIGDGPSERVLIDLAKHRVHVDEGGQQVTRELGRVRFHIRDERFHGCAV